MFVTVYTYLVTPLVIKSINTIHLNLIKVRHYNINFSIYLSLQNGTLEAVSAPGGRPSTWGMRRG